MIMNADQENFDSLRRLLKLKRHEQPPPGYFDRFPGQVLARIEAGAASGAETPVDGLLWNLPGLQRLLALFEAKPALVGACAAILCAGLIAGFISIEKIEMPNLSLNQASSGSASEQLDAVPGSAFPSGGGYLMAFSSTNPVTSIFDQIKIAPLPASFQLDRK